MAKQTRRPRNKARREIDVKELKVKAYDKESSSKLPHNDPEWYIYDKEMFSGVISMPTLEFKGKAVDWNNNASYRDPSTDPVLTKYSKVNEIPLTTPTVACYLMNPGLEFSAEVEYNRQSKYTAINVAARKMYAELSASNAKTSMYAPQDIATLILALGQIIAMSSNLKRMYGIANHFNFYSRQVPSDIFKAMHVGRYATLSQNLADFRNRVNQLIARIDTIQFPVGLSYFKKCEFIYQNVFVDRDEKMISYHLMAPRSTWEIDEDDYQEGTILKTIDLYDKNYTDHIQILERMIEAVLTSSTFNTIFADIINLANRNVLNTDSLHIDMIPIDYVVEPIYSEQFNWQVMNTTILPFPNWTGYSSFYTPSNDVYPDVDSNLLVYAPVFTEPKGTDGIIHASTLAKNVPIRIPDTNPSQDLFVELLAYSSSPKVSCFKDTTGLGAYVQLRNLPDFWCSNAEVVLPSTTNGADSKVIGIGCNCISAYNTDQIAASSQFVHFPFISVLFDRTADTTDILPISRLSAYTQVNANALTNLRYQTYLGLFSFKR